MKHYSQIHISFNVAKMQSIAKMQSMYFLIQQLYTSYLYTLVSLVIVIITSFVNL